jgi:4-carboxymuconolactone decarboxylase
MLERHHPDFARWIEEHAYGRVLARPGLSADRRELLSVAALAALGQERQLASHARGSLRCGATRAELDTALECIADLVEPARLEQARRIVDRFA